MKTTVRGISHPFRFRSGRVASSEGITHLSENIEQIIQIAPGEVPFKPGFGCKVALRSFDPINLAPLAEADIVEAVTEFEPRVVVTNVDADLSQGGAGEIRFEVAFREKGTNEVGSTELTYEG